MVEVVGHRKVVLDRVAVPAALTLLEHEASFDEVPDDAERGSLGDIELDGEIAQAGVLVAGGPKRA